MQFSRTPEKFAAGWNLVGTFGWHILQKPHETEGDLQMQSEEKWWTDTKLFALDYMCMSYSLTYQDLTISAIHSALSFYKF